MKFIKKPALATSSDTITHYHSTNSFCTDTFLSCCLRNLAKFMHSLKRECDDFNQKNIHSHSTSIASAPIIDWAPLIKATSSNRIGRPNNHHPAQHVCRDPHPLTGWSILCVGGRIKFYPEYARLIENYGGRFNAFHGDSNNHLEHLPKLLKKADMIICPVDCVNHDAFLAVKYYCKYSGKPCVLLDRSEVNTFSTGIHMLIAMMAK